MILALFGAGKLKFAIKSIEIQLGAKVWERFGFYGMI